MKYLFFLLLLTSCVHKSTYYEVEEPQETIIPGIQGLVGTWYRIEYPNINPVHYYFSDNGEFTSNIDAQMWLWQVEGNEIVFQGQPNREWIFEVTDENAMMIIEPSECDTFLIVAK